MKLMIPVLFALIGGFVGDASASGRTFRTYSCGSSYGHSYYQPTYYYPQAPHSISYQPDIAALAQAMLASLEEQKALREDFNRMAQQGFAGPQAQAAPTHAGFTLMVKDCGRCHDARVAKSKGRDYVFFRDGQIVANDEEIDAMVKAVDEGRMPKDRKWTGEEKYAFLSFWTLGKPPATPQKAELPPAAQPKVDARQAEIERIVDARLQELILKLPPPEKKKQKEKD